MIRSRTSYGGEESSYDPGKLPMGVSEGWWGGWRQGGGGGGVVGLEQEGGGKVKGGGRGKGRLGREGEFK